MGSGSSQPENNNTINETTIQSVTDSSDRAEVVPQIRDDIEVESDRVEHFDSREETLIDGAEHLEHLYPKEEDSTYSNKDVSEFSEESIHLPADKLEVGNIDNEESEMSLDKQVDNVLNDTMDLAEDGEENKFRANQPVELKDSLKPNRVGLSSLEVTPVPQYFDSVSGGSLDTLKSGVLRKDPAREYQGRLVPSSSGSLVKPRSREDSARSSWSDHQIDQRNLHLPMTNIDRNSDEWIVPVKPIQGFDPHKFAAVNKKASQQVPSYTYNQEDVVDPLIMGHDRKSAYSTRSNGKIKYDNSEEELLACIEREFS